MQWSKLDDRSHFSEKTMKGLKIPSIEERIKAGRALRKKRGRTVHAGFNQSLHLYSRR